MSITYTNDIGNLRSQQLDGFFVGWPNHPSPSAHLEILQGSYAAWLAFNEDCCVGFVNALSDGVFYSFIPLLEVLPEFQGQGIGRELVRRMVSTLENMYAIDIVCDESLMPFYNFLGFNRCVGMVKRNFANQSGRTQ
ncbi:GNAT family N-acetyltransferase [bacterium]|jgi:ribosomal protein S18 acetylase RimI-like enzyme|nr:GNAT family N-acetyltransferase [bacterium]